MPGLLDKPARPNQPRPEAPHARLPKAPPGLAVERVSGDYRVQNEVAAMPGLIHAEVLLGPRYHASQPNARQVLLLHSGIPGGNHTLLERPARWLLARDLYDMVILPDPRGTLPSSPLPRPFSLAEQVADLRALLDKMNVQAPLELIGVSYAGPLALALAAADTRITRVALLASGERRAPPNWLVRFLLERGLLRRLIDRQLRRSLGKRPPRLYDFDPGYDALSPAEMSRHFNRAIHYLPAEQRATLRDQYEARLLPACASLPAGVQVTAPLVQVIGEGDEVWGGVLDPARYPRLVRRVVPGALLHHDLFLRANDFWMALMDALEQERGAESAGPAREEAVS